MLQDIVRMENSVLTHAFSELIASRKPPSDRSVTLVLKVTPGLHCPLPDVFKSLAFLAGVRDFCSIECVFVPGVVAQPCPCPKIRHSFAPHS